MSDELRYICDHCGGTWLGANHGFFVTGEYNVVACSLWCLVDRIATLNNSVIARESEFVKAHE